MPRVQVGAIQLSYEWMRGGPVDAAAAPLVLVHGLASAATAWQPVAGRLSASRSVLVYDLRGHGDSSNGPLPDHTTTADLAADLALLLEHLGIERCHLLGHSLGGIIALEFALAHPAVAASLILVSTTPEAMSPPDSRQGAQPLSAPFEQPDGLQAADAASLPQHSGGPDLVQRLDLPGPREAAGALVRRPDLLPRLDQIVAPALILAGEFDPPLVQRGAELLHGWIANSRLVRIAGAGHHAYREQPRPFVNLVLTFIQEVETPAVLQG